MVGLFFLLFGPPSGRSLTCRFAGASAAEQSGRGCFLLLLILRGGVFVCCLGPHRPFTHSPVSRGFSCRAVGAGAEVFSFSVATFLLLRRGVFCYCCCCARNVCFLCCCCRVGACCFAVAVRVCFFCCCRGVFLLFAVWVPTGSSLTYWFAGASAAGHNNKKAATTKKHLFPKSPHKEIL